MDDLVFEGRNKAYGAYQLRKNYEKRLLLALGITALAGMLICGGIYLKTKYFTGPQKTMVNIHEATTITAVAPKAEKPLPPPPKMAPPKVETSKVKTVVFTRPVVVKNETVNEPPPSQEELGKARIDIVKTDGIDAGNVVSPQLSINDDKGIVEIKKFEKETDEPFARVEIEAAYPGGAGAWRNLSPEVAIDNGAGPGSYTVLVQFIVDAAGNVSDIKAVSATGYGMEQEAVRVIKKSGKWAPAMQNGRQVKAYRRQPVTFVVQAQ